MTKLIVAFRNFAKAPKNHENETARKTYLAEKYFVLEEKKRKETEENYVIWLLATFTPLQIL
jgi:hypothetical protein